MNYALISLLSAYLHCVHRLGDNVIYLSEISGWTMSARVRRHLNFVRVLINPDISEKQKKNLLEAATKEEVLSLCEIVLNFLMRNIPVSDGSKESLYRYRQAYRRLTPPKEALDWKQRKDLLTKHSRAIVKLLQIVYPVLESTLQQDEVQ